MMNTTDHCLMVSANVRSLIMRQWSVVFIIFVWLAFVAWGFYLFAKTIGGRKTGFTLACLVSALCIVAFLLLNENYREQNLQQYGVVMAASSYVKSAPDERGNDQ